MSVKETEKQLEDQFIEWQLQLQGDDQEGVRYDHYDRTLNILFLKRVPSFTVTLKNDLQEMIQKHVDESIRVSTIKVPEFA